MKIDLSNLSPEDRSRIEEMMSKIVYRRCGAKDIDGAACGEEMKFAGRCRHGHRDASSGVEQNALNTYPMSGLRMPEGYVSHPVSDGGSRPMRRVDFDDADDLMRRFLPANFITAYEALIDRGVGSRTLGSGSGYRETPGGGATKLGFSSASEAAVRLRNQTDRKLRRIAREISAWLEDKSASTASRKCQGKCKRIGEAEWIYCPNCGGPMSEVD